MYDLFIQYSIHATSHPKCDKPDRSRFKWVGFIIKWYYRKHAVVVLSWAPGGWGGGGRGCFILTSFLYGPSQLGRSESRLVRGQTESWYLKEYNGTNPTRHTNPPSVNKLIDASLVSKFQIIHIQQGSIDSLKGKTLIITDVFHSLTYSNHKPYSQCRG